MFVLPQGAWLAKMFILPQTCRAWLAKMFVLLKGPWFAKMFLLDYCKNCRLTVCSRCGGIGAILNFAVS